MQGFQSANRRSLITVWSVVIKFSNRFGLQTTIHEVDISPKWDHGSHKPACVTRVQGAPPQYLWSKWTQDWGRVSHYCKAYCPYRLRLQILAFCPQTLTGGHHDHGSTAQCSPTLNIHTGPFLIKSQLRLRIFKSFFTFSC